MIDQLKHQVAALTEEVRDLEIHQVQVEMTSHSIAVMMNSLRDRRPSWQGCKEQLTAMSSSLALPTLVAPVADTVDPHENDPRRCVWMELAIYPTTVVDIPSWTIMC
jgi:hypothetical protein